MGAFGRTSPTLYWRMLSQGLLRRYRPLIFTFVALTAVFFALQYTGGLAGQEPAAEAEESIPVFVDTTDPNELLPDIVPLPPRDMKVERLDDGRILLYFSTTYYNQGRGSLELRADPATAGIREDIERDILQRIYFADDGHRDKVVGHFLWHQEHLHYHYADFITYDLEPVDAPEREDLSGNLVKSTFCIRDISRVLMDLPNALSEAEYDICGKELQGVSVGWGDTYYWDYPAQNLDISDLTSGTYRLSFIANPAQRLEEIRYDNNSASALFRLDMENVTLEVLEEIPENTPEVEHVHLEDPFGVNYSTATTTGE